MKRLIVSLLFGSLLLVSIASAEVYAAESNTQEGDTVLEVSDPTLLDVEEVLFKYFETEGIHIEKNSSELFNYLQEQLTSGSDENLKKHQNYNEILGYATNFVGNYELFETGQETVDLNTTLAQAGEINESELDLALELGSKNQRFQRAAFNKTAAVAYARKYAIWQNGSYPYYTADCTNFVSQIIQAGGMNQTTAKNASGHAWYIKQTNSLLNKWDVSIPWINAHQFAVYMSAAGKNVKGYTTAAQVKANAQVGDVLAYKGKSAPYNIWHLSYVTKKSGNDIFVTQHSVSLQDVNWNGRLDMNQNTVLVIKY